MGITHYSILNSLVDNASFTFVEPNKKLVFFAKKNIEGDFVSSDKNLKTNFDLTIITTPPFVHVEILNTCYNRGDKHIFIEKPFGGHSNNELPFYKPNTYIGYVLRFNPVVNWIKQNIQPFEVSDCYAEYLSNTIESKPKGWRNSKYSGVLNEMGSHVLDLINYLFELKESTINSKEIITKISDVDDIVKFELTSNSRNFNFYFNWIDKSVRKPMFKVVINLRDKRRITFDQQKIQISHNNNKTENISVVDLVEDLPFYLRGIDFTKQMQDLLEDRITLCSVEEAISVNKLMNAILEK